MPIQGLTEEEKVFLMRHYVQSEIHRTGIKKLDPEKRGTLIDTITSSSIMYSRIITLNTNDLALIWEECELFD